MRKSQAPIITRLLDHLRRLSGDVIADYRDSLHSGTPEAVADYRETFVQEVVGRFFPRTYRVSKGAVFDSHGERSQSIDCVVCAANHPLFLDALGRNTSLLADGVHCAIEVKPDLTDLPPDYGASRKQRPEIIRGLEQARTCKRLRRARTALLPTGNSSDKLKDYASRVPTHIFSMESVPVLDLCKYVADYYKSESVPLSEQVDLIVVLNRGVVQVSKCPEQGLTRTLGEAGTWTPGVVAHDLGKDALAYFLLRAVSDVGPEMLVSDPVLQRYLGLHDWPKPSVAYAAYDR